MTGTPHSHVAFLVTNLEEGMARFTEILGVRFHPPRTAFLERVEDPHPHPVELRFTYSAEGPPHIELVEAQDAGVYALAHGEGVHHVGVWESGLARHADRMGALGLRSASRVVTADGGLLTWMNEPSDAHGVRFEFVDDAGREMFEHFMKTGEFEGEMRF